MFPSHMDLTKTIRNTPVVIFWVDCDSKGGEEGALWGDVTSSGVRG